MAQSTPVIDRIVSQGTAAHDGGTFTVDVPIPTDKVARLRGWAFLSAASAGHLSVGASICAEWVVENKNGTLSTPTALTGSKNPNNSDTSDVTGLTGDLGIQASDSSFGSCAADWSIQTTNARLTITNSSADATDANVTVIVDVMYVGST